MHILRWSQSKDLFEVLLETFVLWLISIRKIAINFECNWWNKNKHTHTKNEVRICFASGYKLKTDYFPIETNSCIENENGLVRQTLELWCVHIFTRPFILILAFIWKHRFYWIDWRACILIDSSFAFKFFFESDSRKKSGISICKGKSWIEIAVI